MGAYGVDVSEYQPRYDWKASKAAGNSFGFAKATQSNNFRDSSFKRHWSAMKTYGFVRGAYHFADPAEAPAVEQARYFADHVTANGGFERGDWACLDIEGPSNVGRMTDAEISSWCRAWLAEARRRVPAGVGLIVYTGLAYTAKLSGLTAYPLWVAQYSSPPRVEMPYTLHHWSDWLIHQYTDKPVDKDYARVSAAELRALAAGSAGEGSAPAAGDGLGVLVDLGLRAPLVAAAGSRVSVPWDVEYKD